jgi:hypothetical protein
MKCVRDLLTPRLFIVPADRWSVFSVPWTGSNLKTRYLFNIVLTMSELKLNFELQLKYLKDVKIVTVSALYFSAAWVGHFLAFPDSNALPVWPATGVAFALIILPGFNFFIKCLCSFLHDGLQIVIEAFQFFLSNGTF